MKEISKNMILKNLWLNEKAFKEIMWIEIWDFIKSDKIEFYIAKWIDYILKNK